ncbi:DUF4198 domain-containing protein [Acinetobacter puyangensis]|uniref:DUF4198 domain-containing protein n=1 Tax=Acinetobacter puyangensis TaxID=1096779 RepID=UPI003A4DA7BE
MKRLTTLVLALTVAMTTQAHMLWLERGTDQKTQAYFGEYAESVKETQAGPLKAFNNAKAIQDKKQLIAKVQNDHLEYATQGLADVRVNNDLVHGDMLAQFHAKTGRQDTKAVSELEIVPMAANSNQFTVIFQGKPLAKQEVVVTADNRWSKKYFTDEQGHFNIETPWKGQYVLEAGKGIDEAGEFNKQVYKNRYLVATLSFNVN